MIDVCLLGTGGTMPLKSRWLSSALVRHNGKCVLFDCGEGTQIALKCANFTFKPIDVICLTHFHADHVSGLPGMLLSMGNEGREQPVLIIGPKGTKEVVSSLCTIAPGLSFDIEIAELTDHDETFCFNGFTIKAFKVNHAVSCYGYRIDVSRAGKFDVEKAKANNVPLSVWSQLQKEESVVFNGKTYTSNMVLGEKRKGISFVYSTDTRPTESLYENCKGANLAILEGMYGADEKESHAKIKMHMTFAEAADIALKSEVEELWLTHYSPSMPNPQDYISEAQSIFPNTKAGYDGKTLTIQFPE